MTGSTYAAAAGPVRGRYAADRAGGRSRCGRRLPVRDRDGQDRGPRARDRRVRARGAEDRAGADASSARPTRPITVARSASSWTAYTRTTWRPCWTPAGSRYGPGTTVRGRCTSGSAYSPRPGVLLPVHDARGDRRARRRPRLRPYRSSRWLDMQLDSLYQEIILDHYRSPHHAGLADPYDVEVHHVNPSCGDEVTLRVELDGDTVTGVTHESVGCSISQAATSVMTRPGDRQTGRRGHGDVREVPRADAGPGECRTGRRGSGGRRRVRRASRSSRPG